MTICNKLDGAHCAWEKGKHIECEYCLENENCNPRYKIFAGIY